MSDASSEIVRMIHDTKALSIWSREKGPVFWYAAGVPGPFFVNTEFVIGPDVAARLLKNITAILAETKDISQRSEKVRQAVMAEYSASPAYRRVIELMAELARREFPDLRQSVVSGGERRDWFFSVPLAEVLGLPHLFLFKDKTAHCQRKLQGGEKALHVTDLINNAASYFDAWFPALEKSGNPCLGTVCVNSRGVGAEKLKNAGVKAAAMNVIDAGYFEKLASAGLISKDTAEEIKTYFASAQEWGRRYLTRDVGVFDVEGLDDKSFERLRAFFANDPWEMKKGNEEFFAKMAELIKGRQQNLRACS